MVSFKTLRVCLSCIIRWYGQSNYDYAFSWYVDAHIMTRTAPIARYLNNSSIHRTSSWEPFISWTIKIICGGLVQMWHPTIEDSKWLVHASDHQWPLTFPRLFFDCCLLPCLFFFVFFFLYFIIRHWSTAPFSLFWQCCFHMLSVPKKGCDEKKGTQKYLWTLSLLLAKLIKPWPRSALCAMPQVATVTAFLVGYRVPSCNTFSISTSKPTQKIMLHSIVSHFLMIQVKWNNSNTCGAKIQATF